jgi:hypothetical protein
MDILRYKKIVNTNTLDFNQVRIKTHIPTPDEMDYKRGYVRRYFARKMNDINGVIFEIPATEYTRLTTKPSYVTSNLKWRISGPKDVIMDGDNVVDIGVMASNRAAIKLAAEHIENLSLYLPNLLQFWK